MIFTIIDIKDIHVMFVRSENGPQGAAKAFGQLESKLGSLQGKKFYGVFYNRSTQEYLSCVELDESNPDPLGFETTTIPGGRYSRTKIADWVGKEYTIGPTFSDLEKASTEACHKIDPKRPSIEFYRSQKELFLLLPVE